MSGVEIALNLRQMLWTVVLRHDRLGATRLDTRHELEKRMTSELPPVAPEVIAAHEAGHALAVILFGGEFEDVQLDGAVGRPAEVKNVRRSSLTPLGRVRTAYAGYAAEVILTDDPRVLHREEDVRCIDPSDYPWLGNAEQLTEGSAARIGDT